MQTGTEARGKNPLHAAILVALIGALSANTCHAECSDAPSTTTCRAETEDGHHRAGHPERLACYAQPSDDCNYSGGYVGGGTQFHGCGRFSHEGTWGRDYCGGLLSNRPWLNWSHGRRNRGGSGFYKTDGPKVLKH